MIEYSFNSKEVRKYRGTQVRRYPSTKVRKYGSTEVRNNKERGRHMKRVVISSNPKTVKETMQLAGSRIGSVEFHKRTDGTYRKMAYKFGVTNPTNVPAPARRPNGWRVDEDNTQVTVFDCNFRGEDGQRGAYRKVPLENVCKITVDGTVYSVIGK